MFAQSVFSIWRNFEENSSCRTDTNNIFLSQFKIWGVAFASQAKRTYHFWHIFYRIYEIENTILTNHLSSKTLNNPFRSTLTEYNPGQKYKQKYHIRLDQWTIYLKNIILVWTCDFMESERLNRQCLTSCPTKIFPKFISAETKLVVFNLEHLRVSKP